MEAQNKKLKPKPNQQMEFAFLKIIFKQPEIHISFNKSCYTALLYIPLMREVKKIA